MVRPVSHFTAMTGSASGHAPVAPGAESLDSIEARVAVAVARARAAQPAWAAKSPAERARVLARFREVLTRRRHEVAELVTAEIHRSAVGALIMDVAVTLEFVAWTAREAPRFLRPRWRRLPGLLFLRKLAREEKLPLGVVGIITPWNYPFFMPASCILPAIACGNTVVLKPSELTPRSAAVLESLWREAGLPDGVVEIVQGEGRAGAALTRAGVDKMFFTGSVASGRKVAMVCAEQLIPCSLELGGSDAAIVLADADVQHAADGITWSRFANAGQTCVAAKRVFVEESVHDAFMDALTKSVRALRVGLPTSAAVEIGPLVNDAAVTQITAQFDDAISRGATIAVRAQMPGESASGFFPPTVLTGITDEMKVMQEETFGPLLPVIKVRDADEAVRRANDSPFGLSASVWTRDRARGAAIARRLEAGTVMINDASSVVGAPHVPYGGVKQSGIGRAHGVAGLEACVRSTAITDDLFTAWRQPWWFRYGPKRLAQIDDYTIFAHGSSWWARLKALPGVLKLVFSSRDDA
jgi:acyl-CoA reductase-like NAD-dependent aldehyde dehydrogenase